jgi:hypothetical protein
MRTPAARFLLLVPLAAAVIPALACERDSSCLRTDAGTSDAGGDAAVVADASPDGGSLRRLVTRRLFAGTPVDNRFKDPVFSAVDGSSWNPFDYYTWRPSRVTRVHQKTPGGQPALRIERATGQNRAVVSAMVKTPPGEQTLSIWVGLPAAETPVPPQIRLMGLFKEGPSAVVLAPDPDAVTVTLELITWTRFQALIPEGPLGWSSLMVTHTAFDPAYLTAPVLVPGLPAAAKSRLRLASPRPLTAEERANLEGVFRTARERL